MTEASRFIRYAMPGAVFLLAVGLWLLIDPRGVNLEPLSEPAVAALVVVAALPIGFLVSNVGHGIRHGNWGGLLLGWPQSWYCWPSDTETASVSQLPFDEESDLEAVAVSTYQLDRALQGAEESTMRSRALGWFDLMNALAHSSVALLVALIAILVQWSVTGVGDVCGSVAFEVAWRSTSLAAFFDECSIDASHVWRSMTVGAHLLVTFAVAAVLASGQRRVATLVDRYRLLILTEARRGEGGERTTRG